MLVTLFPKVKNTGTFKISVHISEAVRVHFKGTIVLHLNSFIKSQEILFFCLLDRKGIYIKKSRNHF